jgi:hypothetical protein
VDAQGRPLPSQRLSTGQLAVLVENIPPLSGTRLFVDQGEAYPTSGGAHAQGNSLENAFLELSVSPQTGAIDTVKWKQNGIQLVDGTRGIGLNQYLYVLGTDPEKAQRLANVRVRIKEQGNLVVSLLVEGDAPGATRYSTEIRLVAGINRLDLTTNIDKRSVREKEGIHIAFPFSVPAGQLRYDVANGIVRPEADQLAGACKNFFSVQSWVDVSNRDYGVTWATVNAPLIEIGGITAEQPWMKSIQPSSLIYSYVMNNYWHTNYKADQEGAVTFSYSILPHAAFRASDAARFGAERRQSLIVVPVGTLPQPLAGILQVSSPEVLVSSIKPTAGGHSWLVYFYNPTELTQKVTLQRNDGLPLSIQSSDASGDLGDRLQSIDLAAFSSAYFVISRAGGALDAGHR